MTYDSANVSAAGQPDKDEEIVVLGSRVSRTEKKQIEVAAALSEQSVSTFVRDAALGRARQVLEDVPLPTSPREGA